ncbi:LOW QUALITY PROTEIN: putative eukaryotic translation initiation factor 3 subunit (eif-3) [Schistosoma mansoni]|uniref:putative eukaryotic translation initiation factor 3 subunit (eif-3) n=1 Tax=Schistosoma mansoni TaxID=6183 RepID=UPI00022DC0A9|nr:LOW QUALITY PROTEIN: putative eukaryotic translation initiation factor 3 subunit (eif-3) [Schistosoma mansoni]|eukprot:XP_018649282.1 LOW QUALITY PROTEIN: putative eukaryotic translation initiation factor 3 subunit (eif-3) [Schistosoma mansoni]
MIELGHIDVKVVYECYLEDTQRKNDEGWNKQYLWLEAGITKITECREVSHVPCVFFSHGVRRKFARSNDWNEELQVTRELPQTRLTERLLRDRAIFKSNSDFVAAATRAAVSVVNGDIMAINPGETRKQQMFIWNNMFFSLGFDVKDHYKHFGGEYAAYAATSSDLCGVRAYSMLDQPGLYTLGTAIIDYRGFRVTAQTIIPGILEKEQEQLVVYGSIDFGKTVLTDKRYEELLSKTAKQLKIKPHKVVNHSGDTIQLYSSVDCKGIVGNDNRTYILDLLRTFPPDLNYLDNGSDIRPQLSPELVKLGYPYQHRHMLATLRQELIEAFFDHRYEIFLRLTALEIQKSKSSKGECDDQDTTGVQNKQANCSSTNDDPLSPKNSLVTTKHQIDHHDVTGHSSNALNSGIGTIKSPSKNQSDDLTLMKKLLEDDQDTQKNDVIREAIRKAAEAVGSQSTDRFELTFNPDIYQKFVKFCDSEEQSLTVDQELVCSACEFLVLKQIPAFVRDALSLCITPQDGRALIELMHQRGINVRYLNRVIESVSIHQSLGYLKKMAICEVLLRSAKHLFKTYLQDVDPMLLSVGVAHFLNCFLTACPNLTPLLGIDEQVLKLNRNKKNKKKLKNLRESPEEMAWLNETHSSLWSEIIKEAKEYYHYQITASDIDEFCKSYEVQRIQLLRTFCTSVGIQLLLREYNLNLPNGVKHHQKPVFNTEDIISLYPIVKHLHPHATDAYHYFTTGQARISAGHLQEGFELINEALSLLNGVYGPLHPDIGACNRLLARLSYVMGEHEAAILFQHRATMISERVHGIDNPNTATEYIHFSLYVFACGHISTALQLLYRARYIALLCHGECHPEITQIDFYGERNLKEAFTCHLISLTYTYRGDFRTALDYEKRRFLIYKERLGPDSDYTKDSDECLRQLTQQAVTIARKVAELTTTASATNSGSLTLPMPTVSSVLETLNRVNGILVIQIRGKDDNQHSHEEDKNLSTNKSDLTEPHVVICDKIRQSKNDIHLLSPSSSDNKSPRSFPTSLNNNDVNKPVIPVL